MVNLEEGICVATHTTKAIRYTAAEGGGGEIGIGMSTYKSTTTLEVQVANPYILYFRTRLLIPSTSFLTLTPSTSLPANSRKLFRELLHRVQCVRQMLVAQLHTTALSERARRPDGVFDLPPVDLALRELVKEVLPESGRLHTDFTEEGGPDLLARVLGELVEVQRDVDAREEGLVESFNPVGGQEEDAAVVLDVAKAARNVL